MICIHHNKDLDGFSSGALVKLKYPDCKLLGWDYAEPIPDLEQFKGEEVIMIDISFPMEKMNELARIARNVTWIDHHISPKKDFDNALMDFEKFTYLGKINYVYQLGIAACEIGWKHFFRDKEIPEAITLLGKYDTWRDNGTEDWYDLILPFQFAMRTKCTSAETFPVVYFDENNPKVPDWIDAEIQTGRSILNYQEQQDMLACKRSAFERDVFLISNSSLAMQFGRPVGSHLRGLCLNARAFSSETMKTVYDPAKHDVMIGFEYTGKNWSVSLRSVGDRIDCSLIAKARGGGGHKNAAGFEVNDFEDIFK